jgi:hypothetical protein
MTPPLECNCASMNFERVVVHRFDGKDYTTEFVACVECRVMYHCPGPKKQHEVPAEARPGAYWMSTGPIANPKP